MLILSSEGRKYWILNVTLFQFLIEWPTRVFLPSQWGRWSPSNWDLSSFRPDKGAEIRKLGEEVIEKNEPANDDIWKLFAQSRLVHLTARGFSLLKKKISWVERKDSYLEHGWKWCFWSRSVAGGKDASTRRFSCLLDSIFNKKFSHFYSTIYKFWFLKFLAQIITKFIKWA